MFKCMLHNNCIIMFACKPASDCYLVIRSLERLGIMLQEECTIKNSVMKESLISVTTVTDIEEVIPLLRGKINNDKFNRRLSLYCY